MRSAAALLTASLVVALAIATLGHDDDPGSRERDRPAPARSASKLVRPSHGPPVIMLVFDEWPLDAILRADGSIDEGRYPNLARFARTATWYPNATTVYDSTERAVPALLDGRLPRRGTPPPSWRDTRGSVFDLLGQRGYRVSRREPITSMCAPRWCADAQRPKAGLHPSLLADRRGRLADYLGGIRARRGHLYVVHALLPHGPYIYLPSGRQVRPNSFDAIPGMGGPGGFDERFLTEHKEQRLRLQLGAVDRELGRLFGALRRSGRYDDALIAIAADHGISAQLGVRNRRDVTPANVHEIAPVPLLIKAPRQRRGRIDRSWIRTVDVLPTIARLLRRKVPAGLDGHAAGARETRRRQGVSISAHAFRGSVRISAGALLARRRAARRRAQRIFGSGDWSSIYRIGPHPQLIGRAPRALERAKPNGLAGALVHPERYASVRAGAQLWPTQVAGAVTGSAAGQRRDVAIAVNGRIRAVARSFRLDDGPAEYFAAMVPERSLHAGRNDVSVFEVLPGARALRLLVRTRR